MFSLSHKGILKGAADLIHSTEIGVTVLNTSKFRVNDEEQLHHAAIAIELPQELRETTTLARQIQANIRRLVVETSSSGEGCPFSNTDTEGGDSSDLRSDIKSECPGLVPGAGESAGSSRCHGVGNHEDPAYSECTPLEGSTGVTLSNTIAAEEVVTRCESSLCMHDGRTVCTHLPRSECPSPSPVVQCPSMTAANFCLLFPYHIVFDRKMMIKQSGNRMRMACPRVAVGNNMTDVSQIIYPRLPFEFGAILEFFNSNFVVQILGVDGKPDIYVKGTYCFILAML